MYLDTSALVKRYIEEAGSDTVREVLADEDVMQGLVSVIIGPEIASVLARRVREGVLDQARRLEILGTWRRDLRFLLEVPLVRHSPILREAERILGFHALRAADAVHVATAQDLSRSIRGNTVVFVTADRRQAEVARAEGLEVSLVPV